MAKSDTTSDKFNEILRGGRPGAQGAAGEEVEAGWQELQRAILAMIEELDTLNASLDLVPEGPEQSRAVDQLDAVVEELREVIETADGFEVLLGIEDDDLLEPDDVDLDFDDEE